MKKLLLNKSFLFATPLLVVPIVASSCSNKTNSKPAKFDKNNLSSWGKSQKQTIIKAFLASANEWINENNTNATWNNWALPQPQRPTYEDKTVQSSCEQINSKIVVLPMNRTVKYSRVFLSSMPTRNELLRNVLAKGIAYTVTAVKSTTGNNPISGSMSFAVIGY